MARKKVKDDSELIESSMPELTRYDSAMGDQIEPILNELVQNLDITYTYDTLDFEGDITFYGPDEEIIGTIDFSDFCDEVADLWSYCKTIDQFRVRLYNYLSEQNIVSNEM